MFRSLPGVSQKHQESPKGYLGVPIQPSPAPPGAEPMLRDAGVVTAGIVRVSIAECLS